MSTKPPLFEHQRKEIEVRTQTKVWALFWEMGTAKSRPIIEQAAQLYREGKIDCVVVVTDAGVHSNWALDELPAWMPDDVPWIVAEYHSSKAKTKTHQHMVTKVLNYKKGLAFLCTTWDACLTKAGKQALWGFLQRKCMFVADESIAIKNPDASRTEVMLKAAEYAAYRRILNGTPVDNSPLDVYSQIQFLDRSFWAREVDCASFTAFKAKFTDTQRCNFAHFKPMEGRKEIPGRDYFERVVGYKNLDVLHNALQKISSRVVKEDVLKDLPPKLYSWKYFEMTDEQSRIYRKLTEEAMADIGEDLMSCTVCEGRGEIGDEECPACLGTCHIREGLMTAPSAIVRLLRMQQVLCSYQTADNEPISDIPGKNPRLDALRQSIENRNGQFIVFGRWKRDMDKISGMLTELGVSHGVYDGRTGPDERTRLKHAFQAGDVEGFVGNWAACSKGLTLTKARSVHAYNNGYRLLLRVQGEDRAHRSGLTHSVTYYDYACPGTVDIDIVNNLRMKIDLATAITGDKIKQWLSKAA